MRQEPYCSAKRVFWVVDNGSSHRGRPSIDRMNQWYLNALVVHTPIHASWLNQVEIYFSVVQRKVLSPIEFNDLAELENSLLGFQRYHEQIAKPFEWKFTRDHLKRLPAKAADAKVAPSSRVA